MTDPRILKLADMLVDYSVAVKPGDKVVIYGSSAAEPLLKAIYARVLLAGGLPMLWPQLPGQMEVYYKLANEEQLAYIPEPLKVANETVDVEIHVMAEVNTKALSNVDPNRLTLRRKATAEMNRKFLQRAARGEVRWTLCLYPTQAYAQDAEMGIGEYEDFVYQACMPEPGDPVGYWQKVSSSQQKIIDWLQNKNNVHLFGPETDLRLSIAGRKFINCDCKENIPDGEIFTGPVEDSVEGYVYFSYPTIYAGREIIGVRLWFEKGRVVRATADKNEDFLLKTLDTDSGARYVGEFAIGTNAGIQRFTRQILFDEKIGGSFHMALGEGYPESGSQNHSGLHWDMICDLRSGGEIWVDGEQIYKNGEFVLNF